jgi:iron complex outermembrane receptor protein
MATTSTFSRTQAKPAQHRAYPARARATAWACSLMLGSLAHAEGPAADPKPAATEATTLERVLVQGKADPAVQAGGWGESSLSRLPLSASVVSREQMLEKGVQRLADLGRSDVSVSDAYNAQGYWDYLTVRGFVIDNRYNYRRDGLPINAETSIALDNKERVEVLKGTSGLQAGTSAPGGLVNLVVKRPLEEDLRSVSLAWRERNTWLLGADLNQRFDAGGHRTLGLRINAATEHIDPLTRQAKGERNLLALASDWRLSSADLFEAEFEHSHRSQPSVPAYSLLGNSLPAPVDGRTNLNNQPWTLPVVLDGDTASLRYTRRLGDQTWLGQDAKAVMHWARQELTSQDRAAFPYGCSKEGNYDRYCSDGSFDLYDYRSENERRTTDALDLSVQGRVQALGLSHQYGAGVLFSRAQMRFQDQAYNYAGEGRIDGSAVTPAAPSLSDANTNRDERSTELYLRDAMALNDDWKLWAGLRHSRLQRESVRTSGEPRATDTTQSFTTPWLALSAALQPGSLAYLSWGQGVESEVVPNRGRYTNAGQAYASKSRQMEAGLKHEAESWFAGAAAFDITRPFWADAGSDCGSDTPGQTCTRREDGRAHHRGIEAQAGLREGRSSLSVAGMWMQARREGSTLTPELNLLSPTNVPERNLSLQARHHPAAWPGLSLMASYVIEGPRAVLPDNSVKLPSWQQWDIGASYHWHTSAGVLTLRAGIDNLLDTRAWREAPYQFGHVYLFPLQGRTARASAEWAF